MRNISKEMLEKMYIKEQRSISYIAQHFSCSENKINYWADKFNLKKRSISQALYIRNNPLGDPFTINYPQTKDEWFLYGLGIGLYWGEGNKANTHAVRLGNTDPGLIRKFLEFLHTFYKINPTRLRFGLQLFTDIDKNTALKYWCNELGVSKKQFQKIVVTKSLHRGTYRKKSQHGVLTVYFSNIKLRDIIVSAIEKLQKSKPS